MHNFPKNKDILFYTIDKRLTKAQENEIFCLAITSNSSILCNTKNRPDSEFPLFSYAVEDNEFTGIDTSTSSNEIRLSFEQFKAFIQGKGKYKKPFSQSVKLNNTHTAIVTKKDIHVGCQKFTHEAIERLYRISLKAQKTV